MSLDEYLEGWVRGTRDAHTDACSITMADGFYFRGYAAGRAAYTEARRAEEERATACPESGEEALKPGDEVEARYVKATDGTMVASFGEFIVCNRSVRADELPAILVEVAAHIPAAELRAVLARVRVP